MRTFAPWIMLLAASLIVPDSLQLSAQTFVTPRGEAQNVRFEQGENGVITVFYDLISTEPRAVFAVALEASHQSGGAISMQPGSISGDVGNAIRPGIGKRIVWDAAKDVERVQVDRFRFRINATAAPLSVESAAPTPVKPAAPTPAAAPTKPAQPATQAKKKGINPLIWVGAAGGAAGVGALALRGDGTTDPPGTNTGTGPTTTTPSTIVGSWAGTVASSSTVPFGGGGYCDYTVALSDIRLSFDVDASLVVSNVQLRHTLNEAAIACPFQPYPPNEHNYELTGQQTSSNSILLNLRNTTGAPTNNVQVSASLQSPNVVSARLTFDRFLYPGEGPTLNWRVTVTPNMTRTR
jgi:hypothetical protein